MRRKGYGSGLTLGPTCGRVRGVVRTGVAALVMSNLLTSLRCAMGAPCRVSEQAPMQLDLEPFSHLVASHGEDGAHEFSQQVDILRAQKHIVPVPEEDRPNFVPDVAAGIQEVEH